MVRILAITLLAAFLTSCKTTQQISNADSPSLVHIVLFKLKTSMSEDDLAYLEKEIWKMSSINVVQNLQVGHFEDLEDNRAMDDYQMIMYMEFKNRDDYLVYKNHAKHQLLKDRCKDFLAGVPRTYDYLKQ